MIAGKRAPIPKGLDVPKTLNFGQLEPGKSHTLQLCITNGTEVPHLLLACKLSSSTKQVAHAKVFQPTLIASGDKHSLDLVCTASQVGTSHERIELEFEEGFIVYCVATVSVVDPLEKQLQPSSKSVASAVKRSAAASGRISEQVLWTVPGEQCPTRKGKLPVGLPHFPVNARFWKMSRRELERFVSVSLRQPLQPSNYVEKLQLLLHLEEVQHTRELQEQTLCPALMRLESKGNVRLDLTDWLGEARAPPRLGDRVIVQPVGGDSAPEGGHVNYEGFVHRVMSEDTLLRFSPTFNKELVANPLQTWELRFLLNRTPLRRCHLAVRLCKPLLHSVLFPRGAVKNAREQPLKLVNEQLNELQQEAVKRIVASHRSTVPFIVWGPPGTGKTVTLVEAILQVYLNISHSRMLVCAPSNSAADLLTEKLWASGLLVPSDIVRLLGFQRDLDAVPARIRPLCVNTNKLERASHHRIVVSTIVTAGALYGLGLPADHFTHGFLDEAGQATEPECLVLAGLVCLAGGSLVLCGDPMQLGPVLRSRLAARGGLGESMLHRLLLGGDDGSGASPRCSLPFTRLRNSYRCVQALLEPYSKLFYDGQLLSCVSKQDRGALPDFPVFFHGVRGCALREGACPSWFNPSEAMQVMHYLQRAYGPWGLLPSEVGLLTPYRRQTLKLRSLITSLRLPTCKIGSAEEFQGQERRLIIVSTVRGSEAMVGNGSGEPQQSLDFLFCARRFNVAISRASAMLVVVGNPDVLTLDKHWKSLMDYCADHGTYHGCHSNDVAAP